MANPLCDYYDALERLRANCPKNVPRGTPISNDAVSLEAGRKKGSINKSRKQFSSLIVEIDAARRQKMRSGRSEVEQLSKLKAAVAQLRKELEAALAREFSLVLELREIHKQLTSANEAKLSSFRQTK